MPLYYVAYGVEENGDLDWFVRADTPEEAVELWLQTELVKDAVGDGKTPNWDCFLAKWNQRVGNVFTVPPHDGPTEVVQWPHTGSIPFILS